VCEFAGDDDALVVDPVAPKVMISAKPITNERIVCALFKPLAMIGIYFETRLG
jgi:hypothetical protein